MIRREMEDLNKKTQMKLPDENTLLEIKTFFQNVLARTFGQKNNMLESKIDGLETVATETTQNEAQREKRPE